jgi:putative PEP-CTERM system TPR-repeat lipoprotein
MNRLAGLYWIVLLCVAAGACSGSGKASGDYVENGNRLLKEGKTQEAIIEYRNAIKEDPKSGHARYQLAEAYANGGNTVAATREYVRAADLLPQETLVQIKASQYLMTTGQFDDAKTRLKAVIDRDPSNAEAQVLYGNAMAGLNDLNGAVRQLEDAIRLEPGRANSYSSLAALKLKQGAADEARAAFEKAVELDARSLTAWLSLANFRWSTGELDGAEMAFKKALELSPDHVLANRALAVFYMGSGRAAEAEPYFKTIAAASRSSEANLQLADYYFAQNRAADADKVLRGLARDRRAQAEVEARLAAIAYSSNKAQANSMLDKALAADPANVTANLQKARWLAAEGHFKAAKARAEDAAKADPKSVPARYMLGTIQVALRQPEEAAASFKEVLALNPRVAEAQLYLSRISLSAGRPDAAVSYAESAVANAPEDSGAKAELVRGLLAQRETARAEQELAPLVKAHPQAAQIQALDAMLKLQRNDTKGAREAYARALAINPDLLDAIDGITLIDLTEGRAADARRLIETRLAANPNNPELLILAGRVYGVQRDFQNAETVLRKAITVEPSIMMAYNLLATVYLATGKLESARVEFDELSKRNPRDLGSRTMAALILHSQRKFADATKRYEDIVAADPGAAVAGNNLAMLYSTDGSRLNDALRLANRAAETLPDNAEVQDTIGLIYLKKGLPALAVPAFQKSAAKSPGNASYHLHLAEALKQAGDVAEARRSVTTALKLKPDYNEAKTLLASLKG